jgi:hypothetical protein
MFVQEKYNPSHRHDYFAIRRLMKKTVEKDETKTKTVEEIPPYFIRFAKGNEKGYAKLETDDLKRGGYFEEFMFLPELEKHQTDKTFVVGQAGSGKSWLMNDYVKMYKMIHPKNKVLYFTMNDAEKDKSLEHENFKIVPMREFYNQLKGISDMDEADAISAFKNLGETFKDSLLVFDDIGTLKNLKGAEKLFWNFIDQSLENMRKFGVSVYIISHTSRTGNTGTILKEELQRYIIYPQSLQVQNDRIMNSYFGFGKKIMNRILTTKDRWVSIDTRRKIVITSSEIYSLNEIIKKS